MALSTVAQYLQGLTGAAGDQLLLKLLHLLLVDSYSIHPLVMRAAQTTSDQIGAGMWH
jgi:3-polyprenyl-4-hydroxybenzoate decarboxylase